MRKIILFLKRLFRRVNNIFYVGSSDILPEPLSKEEETNYVLLSMNGDEFARNKLIEHNLRLVVFLAKKYENTMVDLEDLVSIGTIGLIKGVNTYELDKNIKLSTHNKTIGLLIVKKKNKYVIEYVTNEDIYVTTYELVV